MRREPGLKLERSPLVLVLGQVRFSPVLKMKEFVPEIQEALRKQSFSRYREEQMRQVLWGPEIKTDVGTRWVFVTRDQHEAIVLTNDFVVYETSRYDVFEAFTERLRMALQLVGDQVKVDFVEQMGLRYVDVIRTIDGMSPGELLQSSIRGFKNEDLDAKESKHQFIVKAVTAQGDLTIRCVENSGDEILPPDLMETHLVFDVHPPGDEVFRILDVDHISRAQRDFDPATLIEGMWELHDCSSRAFKSAVTPEAIEIWRRKGGR